MNLLWHLLCGWGHSHGHPPSPSCQTLSLIIKSSAATLDDPRKLVDGEVCTRFLANSYNSNNFEYAQKNTRTSWIIFIALIYNWKNKSSFDSTYAFDSMGVRNFLEFEDDKCHDRWTLQSWTISISLLYFWSDMAWTWRDWNRENFFLPCKGIQMQMQIEEKGYHPIKN